MQIEGDIGPAGLIPLSFSLLGTLLRVRLLPRRLLLGGVARRLLILTLPGLLGGLCQRSSRLPQTLRRLREWSFCLLGSGLLIAGLALLRSSVLSRRLPGLRLPGLGLLLPRLTGLLSVGFLAGLRLTALLRVWLTVLRLSRLLLPGLCQLLLGLFELLDGIDDLLTDFPRYEGRFFLSGGLGRLLRRLPESIGRFLSRLGGFAGVSLLKLLGRLLHGLTGLLCRLPGGLRLLAGLVEIQGFGLQAISGIRQLVGQPLCRIGELLLSGLLGLHAFCRRLRQSL